MPPAGSRDLPPARRPRGGRGLCGGRALGRRPCPWCTGTGVFRGVRQAGWGWAEPWPEPSRNEVAACGWAWRGAAQVWMSGALARCLLPGACLLRRRADGLPLEAAPRPRAAEPGGIEPQQPGERGAVVRGLSQGWIGGADWSRRGVAGIRGGAARGRNRLGVEAAALAAARRVAWRTRRRAVGVAPLGAAWRRGSRRRAPCTGGALHAGPR